MRLSDQQKEAAIPDPQTKEVLDYLNAENKYRETQTASLKPFEDKLFEEIKSKKIANKILASILIDPKLGYMTTDVIAKRAEYNASDADYLKAMNSETKMSAIRDKGLDLLKNVYFIILDIKSQESVNDKNDEVIILVILPI